FRDNGTGRNHRVPPDCEAAKNRRVCADGGSVLHSCWYHLPVGVHRPRVLVIRETRMGADENPVADTEALVQSCEVLNLTVVPDDHIRIDVDVLSDVAVLSDARPLSDLSPMPDRRAVSDRLLPGYLS